MITVDNLLKEGNMSKEKVTLSPGDISDNWNKSMKGSVSRIQKGIDAMTVNPMEKAADQADLMLAKITEAITSGKWANATRGYSLTDWKAKTKEKVAQRMAGGVDAAMSKRRAFDQYLVTTLNAVLPQIADMPKMTRADSLERVRVLMDHMGDNPFKT